MRRVWTILPLLLAFSPMIRGQTTNVTGELPFNPPAYDLLRFKEHYEQLADPTNRTDFFDPIKYIPLRPDDPAWFLTLGGEVRERFEGTQNPNFGLAGTQDYYWLQRVTLLTDWHLGERVRVFAEGISGLMEGESLPAPPVDKDPIDLQFAFLDVRPFVSDEEQLTVRAGRFGLSLGSGRLVATRAAPNIPFRFDGFESFFESPYWEVIGFLTHPAEDRGGLSGSDHSVAFWGLYTTHWFDARHINGIDWYYLGIRRENGMYVSGTGNELRHSIGTRQFGEYNHWDWNAEEVLQTGTFGSQSILAWTASLDGGYTWADVALQPRFGIKADVTSGDGNPRNSQQSTFDALFFKSGYFNDASLVRPANLIDIHPNWSLQLTKKLEVDGGVDAFWRYSREDAIYAVQGGVAVPALPNSPGYFGTAFDLNMDWHIQRHLTLQASWVYFLSGQYVSDAGGTDVNYVSVTLSFLF